MRYKLTRMTHEVAQNGKRLWRQRDARILAILVPEYYGLIVKVYPKWWKF
jgi:hypothetical protein